MEPWQKSHAMLNWVYFCRVLPDGAILNENLIVFIFIFFYFSVFDSRFLRLDFIQNIQKCVDRLMLDKYLTLACLKKIDVFK